MAAAMASQERNSLSLEDAGHDDVGRIAERRFNADFFGVVEAPHGVEAAATDDADSRVRLPGTFSRSLRFGFQSRSSLSRVELSNEDGRVKQHFSIR